MNAASFRRNHVRRIRITPLTALRLLLCIPKIKLIGDIVVHYKILDGHIFINKVVDK